jgi:exodeoxyribonuclease VII large subunit
MDGQRADSLTAQTTYTLYELTTHIKAEIAGSFPGTCWIIAEIAEAKCNQKGHCYLELVEKEDDRIIAQIKATIWAYEYRKLSHTFQAATGETLKAGMKILFSASVTFHEVYGLSLNIRDIDPSYTMGEMARKKKEVIERLKKEGIIDLNKGLCLPLVPQRVAVVSAPGAAGYGDFFNQLDNNPYGYRFVHILFPALMQGQDAERSIIAALEGIRKKRQLFDVVAIIRGGGSAVDLSCFDGYPLASHVVKFPLPVITGIGHEKDDTVVDLVAHTRMKTPTAVAEFLISGVRSFDERIMDLRNRVVAFSDRLLKEEKHRLHDLGQRLRFLPVRLTATVGNRLIVLEKGLSASLVRLKQKEEDRLHRLEQAVRLLDPQNVLRRGYSITRRRGKVIRDASSVRKGDVLETTLYNGNITSVAAGKKERGEHEQEQTDCLLPGFDRA